MLMSTVPIFSTVFSSIAPVRRNSPPFSVTPTVSFQRPCPPAPVKMRLLLMFTRPFTRMITEL